MLPVIFKEYDELADKLITLRKKGDFLNFFHFMIDLEQGPCVIKRVKGCGSGTEYVAVTPDGDIYPCHRFVGNSRFIMGNVMNGFDTDKKISAEFAECNVLTKPECEKCFAKYYCSGGALRTILMKTAILKNHMKFHVNWRKNVLKTLYI